MAPRPEIPGAFEAFRQFCQCLLSFLLLLLGIASLVVLTGAMFGVFAAGAVGAYRFLIH